MSIFQIKELWSTTIGNSEEFDKNSIAIANIDGSNPPENKIIVGNKYLRVILHYRKF